MKKSDSFNDSELEKVGLVRIFSNMDTQSAVVAAVVISLGTILVNYLMELCNFVYWIAYFKRFNIPLVYFDEAIISETGVKYAIILCAPLVVLMWWCLSAVSNKIDKLATSKMFSKLKKVGKQTKLLDDKKWYVKCIKITTIFLVYAVLCVLGLSFWSLGVVDRLYDYRYICVFLYAEVTFFVLSKICKSYFTPNYSFSKREYYYVRIIGGIISVYLVLGCVFFAGSFSNSGSFKGGQVVSLVNESYSPVFDVKEGHTADMKMVLLETTDYYYVTNAEMENRDGGLYLTVWSDDTYRFVEKVGCPITKKYVNLWYINPNYDEDAQDAIFSIYLWSVFSFIFIIGCLLSIPVRKENS